MYLHVDDLCKSFSNLWTEAETLGTQQAQGSQEGHRQLRQYNPHPMGYGNLEMSTRHTAITQNYAEYLLAGYPGVIRSQDRVSPDQETVITVALKGMGKRTSGPAQWGREARRPAFTGRLNGRDA